MDDLGEIHRANESPRTDVARHRHNTIEWLQRARAALEKGDYELCRNQARQAAEEVQNLIPVSARTAA